MEDSIAEGATLYPIFCTADIPSETLDSLLNFAQNDDSHLSLALLTIQSATELSSITHATRAPLSSSPQTPFLNWSIPEIYSFWKQNVRCDLTAQGPQAWTAFTFGVLDSSCLSPGPKNGTLLICSDAPDLGEGEEEVVLKEVRSKFEEAPGLIVAFEMLTMAPSEAGKKTSLAMMPPAFLDTRGFENEPGIVGKPATPEHARFNKAQALARAWKDGIAK